MLLRRKVHQSLRSSERGISSVRFLRARDRQLTGIDVSESEDLVFLLLECFFDLFQIRSSSDGCLDLINLSTISLDTIGERIGKVPIPSLLVNTASVSRTREGFDLPGVENQRFFSLFQEVCCNDIPTESTTSSNDKRLTLLSVKESS